MAITVLLVDDHALFRDGIAEVLRMDGRFEIVGQASRGGEAVAAAARLRPDLILMDLQMPGMSGVEAIRQIHSDDPGVRIGVLTMLETLDSLQSALDAGATGFVIKDATPSDLCDAAAAIAQGHREIVQTPSDDGSPPQPESELLARLTPRELEVLRALTTDATHDAIAQAMGISAKTLRNHISHIYRKLSINDRAQAMIIAIREGLVQVGRH
jgi:DNA-binding NarL/FixJ family response regulator